MCKKILATDYFEILGRNASHYRKKQNPKTNCAGSMASSEIRKAIWHANLCAAGPDALETYTATIGSALPAFVTGSTAHCKHCMNTRMMEIEMVTKQFIALRFN